MHPHACFWTGFWAGAGLAVVQKEVHGPVRSSLSTRSLPFIIRWPRTFKRNHRLIAMGRGEARTLESSERMHQGLCFRERPLVEELLAP